MEHGRERVAELCPRRRAGCLSNMPTCACTQATARCQLTAAQPTQPGRHGVHVTISMMVQPRDQMSLLRPASVRSWMTVAGG